METLRKTPYNTVGYPFQKIFLLNIHATNHCVGLKFNLESLIHIEKKDPDQGHDHFFKIYLIFLAMQKFKIIFRLFFAYFYAKT